MPLSLQSATPDHIDTLLALMHQMQSDDPWDEPFHDLTVKSNLSTLLSNPIYGLVFLALDGSTPIAYLILCFDFSLEYRGKGAWIDELFVTSSYRRKGIASQLLH